MTPANSLANNAPSTKQYVDLPFIYSFSQAVAANALVQNQSTLIDSDSCFVWRGTSLQPAFVTTPGVGAILPSQFSYRFQSSPGMYYSSDFIDASMLDQRCSGGVPCPTFPEVELQPSSLIMIDLQNLTAAQLTAAFAFYGVKRFYAPGANTMLTQRGCNPFAPPVLNGVAAPATSGVVDVDGNYILNLYNGGNTLASSTGNFVTVDTTSDFALRGISVAYTQNTPGAGNALIRFYTSFGYYLCDAYIDSSVFVQGDSTSPFVVFPELVFPAGSKILMDFQAGGAGQIGFSVTFRGVKRFPAPTV